MSRPTTLPPPWSDLALAAGGVGELASLLGPTYPLEQIDDAVADALAGNPKRVLVLPGAA